MPITRSSHSYSSISSEMGTSNWQKLRLLMWKNWLLQWRHKVQLLVEILIPALFTALLVVIRGLVDPDDFPNPTMYQPLPINTLAPLRGLVANSSRPTILNWMLIYSPKNPIFDKLIEDSSNALGLQPYLGVDTPDLIDFNMVSRQALAGIEFHHQQSITDLPKNLSYSLKLPSELRTVPITEFNSLIFNWRTNLLFPRFQVPGPRNREADDGGVPPGYYQEGFLALQNAIASSYLKILGGIDLPQVMVQRYPYPPYVSDVLLTGLETLVSLMIMISFVYPCINTVKFIAREKEKQLKEVMKIMGLPNWLHWTGWFIRTMIFMMFSITLIVILFKVRWYTNTDLTIFTHSDWTALWVFLFAYSVATTVFCFLLSVFFAKANTAAAVAGLVWFLFYSAYSFTMDTYDDLTLSTKLLLSLFHNTAMAYGMQIIIRLEGTEEGLQWNNMFRPVSIDDELSVGLIVVMFLVNSIIYLSITLYVEKIFPGEYGVPERWYFPFIKSFWCPSSGYSGIEDIDQTNRAKDTVEREPVGIHAGVQIKNLRKVYSNNKVAVESLTLNMFDDQITVLLGHNGAGKTTTMSMLCGLFPPSSGVAYVNGCDIRTDINGVRDSLGLCPQHNVLFDELTVKEHIVFYSSLKGLKSKAIDEEVAKYVKLIDLEDKTNAMSSTLSGGMKRKLSVCVAFCGGSKVVLCDEPTSGMDPAARRALWNILKSEKMGRTVLLSTHFMDEADILGDRIAIMAHGHLKCVGSSYFLKKKFGVGYHLICVKKNGCDSDRITNLLQKYVPDAKVENDIGSELSYLLSDVNSNSFQQMFKELEDNITELRVESYGISLSTLEDVFMKVGSDSSAENEDEISQLNGNNYQLQGGVDDVESNISSSFAEDAPLIQGVALLRNQVMAMFKKKFYQTIRSYILMLIQIIIPVTFLIITILAARERVMFDDLPTLDITLKSYEFSVTVLEISPTNDPSTINGKIASSYENQFKHQDSSIELKTIQSDLQAYILDLAETMLVRINSRFLIGATISSDKIIAWFNNHAYHTAPLSVNLLHNAIIKAHLGEDHSIDVTNAPLPFSGQSKIERLQNGGSLGFQLAINVSFAMAFVAAFYMLSYIKERRSKFKLIQFVSGANVFTFWITALLWDLLTMIITMLCMIFTFAAFQEEGWSSPSELGRILAILISFGFAVLPITFVTSMFFTIPTTGFTRMTLFYVFTGIACFFTIFIMSLPIYDLKDVADGLTWGFLIFPHFALSHSLNNYNIIATKKQVCNDLLSFCTNYCDDPISICQQCCNLDYFAWEQPGVGRNVVYMLGTGVVCFIILLLIEFKLVSAVIYGIQGLYQRKFVPKIDSTIDSDVQDEKNRVMTMSKTEIDSHNLVMKDVTKLYGSFLAVNQMSVAVDQSECFGLLGINGAGKTSTFKMLTGDEKISYGQAWARGISLKSNMKKVYQMIGYCPQFDALSMDLTGREILEIFCLLRGIPNNRIRSTCVALATYLNFLRHIDKKVKEYSGGNKRKLSAAVAIVGNPAVIYLDEPTTGMDPAAKRHLWNMICKIRNTGKSIILTSHSMDECEALCTRLAIMVNGEFKCIGSVQHLKNKFSKGFTMNIKMKKKDQLHSGGSRNETKNVEHMTDDAFGEFINNFKVAPSSVNGIIVSTIDVTMHPIKDYVATHFEGAVLQEEYQGLLTYYIPTTSLQWSAMFGLMENAKEQFDIEDYSLSQTTLEQVFLSFTKQQKEETRAK